MRSLHFQTLPTLTPEIQRPSELLKGEKPNADLEIISNTYGSPLHIDLGKSAAETGTLLHRCFEVLDGREDKTGLLEAATGYSFTDEQKTALQQAVIAFENWCYQTFGKHRVHKEIPVTYQDDAGIIISGLIDLLIETDKGYWIIDHKTRSVKNTDIDFLKFHTQLQGYQKGINNISASPLKALGIGLNWLCDGVFSYVKYQ